MVRHVLARGPLQNAAFGGKASAAPKVTSTGALIGNGTSSTRRRSWCITFGAKLQAPIPRQHSEGALRRRNTPASTRRPLPSAPPVGSRNSLIDCIGRPMEIELAAARGAVQPTAIVREDIIPGGDRRTSEPRGTAVEAVIDEHRPAIASSSSCGVILGRPFLEVRGDRQHDWLQRRDTGGMDCKSCHGEQIAWPPAPLTYYVRCCGLFRNTKRERNEFIFFGRALQRAQRRHRSPPAAARAPGGAMVVAELRAGGCPPA